MSYEQALIVFNVLMTILSVAALLESLIIIFFMDLEIDTMRERLELESNTAKRLFLVIMWVLAFMYSFAVIPLLTLRGIFTNDFWYPGKNAKMIAHKMIWRARVLFRR